MRSKRHGIGRRLGKMVNLLAWAARKHKIKLVTGIRLCVGNLWHAVVIVGADSAQSSPLINQHQWQAGRLEIARRRSIIKPGIVGAICAIESVSKYENEDDIKSKVALVDNRKTMENGRVVYRPGNHYGTRRLSRRRQSSQ